MRNFMIISLAMCLNAFCFSAIKFKQIISSLIYIIPFWFLSRLSSFLWWFCLQCTLSVHHPSWFCPCWGQCWSVLGTHENNAVYSCWMTVIPFHCGTFWSMDSFCYRNSKEYCCMQRPLQEMDWQPRRLSGI